MTKCNTLNVVLLNSQFSNWKSGTKIDTEVTLNLSSSVIGKCNDENTFPHKILVTDT